MIFFFFRSESNGDEWRIFYNPIEKHNNRYGKNFFLLSGFFYRKCFGNFPAIEKNNKPCCLISKVHAKNIEKKIKLLYKLSNLI